jgi:glycosyltransferase involved in cell wall biosynthesis
MRILHVHSGNLFGGVETMLMTLARRQDECRNLQQHFALCFEGRLSSELAAVGAVAHPIGAVRVSKPLTILRARNNLRKLLANAGWDALLFHSAWSYAVFASVARAQGLRTVVWMHGTSDGKHWTEQWARRTDPDLVVCNSRFTVDGAAAVYPYALKRVVYCPVELDTTPLPAGKRKAIRAELDTSENAVVIIQVSRMEPGKGQLLHLQALSRLRTMPDWVCWFVGGPQRPEDEKFFNDIRNEAQRLGVAGRVRFLGERSDVPSLLKTADIYCQPNLLPEGFGISLIEALNAGLPVVTTNMGGAMEIINDACGVLVSRGNTDDIASTLQLLIHDGALRRRLGQRGPARAQELCDPATRIRELSDVLTRITLSRN